MAAPKLKYAIGNSSSTTLSSSVSDSATSAPLTSDTNFQAKSGEGMVLVDEGQAAEELAYSTGLSGSSLTIPLANRGLEGGSAQAHDSGASVKGIMTSLMWNDLVDSVLNVVDQADGAVKWASAAEINTGTSTAKFVNPDKLAASNFGIRYIGILVFNDETEVAIGDGAGDVFIRIPAAFNGMNLVSVAASTQTAATGSGTETTDIQIHNVTQAADMLTTKLKIDEDETDSSTAATAAVIDAANDDVATGDQLRIDVDAIPSTTGGNGLFVELGFQLP